MEEVILTIKNNNGFEEDFEIPADIRAEKWIGQIGEYLRQKESFKNEVANFPVLSFKGKVIEESETLKELNIADGSILMLDWR